MIQVVHVGPDVAGKGGMASALREIADSPLAAEHRLEFLTSYRHGTGRPAQVAVFGWCILRIAVWCLRPGRRIVHLHTAKRGSFYRKAILIAVVKTMRRPVVLQLHTGPADIDESWRRDNRLVRTMLGWAFRRADRVLSVSSAGARTLEERFGVAEVTVVRNAAPRLPSAPDAATAVGADEAAQVLYLGGFVDPAKGGEVLVRALQDGLLAGHEARFELAGLGRPPADAASLFEDEHVRWLGWLDAEAKASALHRADIVVLPSISEGLPVWLLEAMLAGRAVVASRTGGIPEIVTDGVDGLLVRAGDPADLARALRELATNPRRRAELGEAAARRAATLNHDEVYEPLRRTYAELSARVR